MQLIDFLDRGHALSRDGACLVEADLRYSYAEAKALSNRMARALWRDGVQPGDRVAIFSPNSATGFLCMLGLLRAGAVLVALNSRNALADNRELARACDIRWLFFHHTLASDARQLTAGLPNLAGSTRIDAGRLEGTDLDLWLADLSDQPVHPTEPPSPDATWRLSSTGGTTGRPKLVEQPLRSAELTVATVLALFHYPAPPRYLLAAPMTHAGGMIAFGYLAMGACIHVLPRISAEALIEAIPRHRIQALFLPPSALYALLAHPAVQHTDWSSLRHFLVGSSPIATERLLQAMDTFGPVMAQGYGQTEAATLLAYMSPADYAEARAQPGLAGRLRSCGRATPFVQIEAMSDSGQILPRGEIGEIVVRTNMAMKGYQNAPQENATVRAHGWHHTGDVGSLDASGFVTLLDRKRDLIISGGFNVFPSEVEGVLCGHSAVEDCAVVGVPDEKWGEAVKAVVQLRAGHTVQPAELQAFCRERLGGVKAPKSFEFWPELPRSAVGKVLRREVRKRFWQADAPQI